MANFLIKSCDDLINIVVNPGENTITIGDIYYVNFTGETNSGCFTVISESTDSIEEGISSVVMYDSCLECYKEEGFGAALVGCYGGFPYAQPLDAFTNLPTIGEYYRFCNPENSEECYCFELVGFVNEGLYSAVYNGGPFSDCTCTGDMPRSANTEVLVCEICNDFTTGDITLNQITPPHPVWTDGYGTSVTQLNMITLGGVDGLNS
jgi:hypothetical protein